MVSKNNSPKISVVMSVYNGEPYLIEAIESILGQTFTDFKFIIVNDGSTDNSLEIIKSYNDDRIILIDQENTGLAKALNNGIKLARGKYIARMDADDISMPNRLELQYEFMEKHPECVALGSNAEIIDMDGNYVFTSNQETEWEKIKKILPQMPFFHSSTMYRKTSFEKVGGYPEIYQIEDVVFFNKLAVIGELRNIQDVLIKYRLVPTAITTKSFNKDSKIVEKIVIKAINDTLTNEDINFLKRITLTKDIKEKKAIYYHHLGKKYLWNNYQPKFARKNFKLSLKQKFNLLSLLYFIITFFPRDFILLLYKTFKQK